MSRKGGAKEPLQPGALSPNGAPATAGPVPPVAQLRLPQATTAGQLLELSVTDFAIVHQLRLALYPGLNALTGETGAGKSILIDALALVLGGRATSLLVRDGASRALVEATFSRPEHLPAELEIEPDDDVLVLSREVGAAGRGLARLNGRSVPLSMLQVAGRALVDLHGQSDHQGLLQPAQQLRLLDRFAQTSALADKLAARVAELRGLRARIASLRAGERDAARQVDLLRFQMEEIGRAAPRLGEEEELRQQRTLLASAEKIQELAQSATAALDADGAALDSAGRALKQLEELTRLDPSLQDELERLRDGLEALREVARRLGRRVGEVEADPAELARLEERLELIRTLKRKYGDSVEEVLAFGRDAATKLDELASANTRLAALEEQERQLFEDIDIAARELSGLRSAAAQELSAQVERQLADLNMAGARFVVAIEERHEPAGPRPSGIDDVEFLLAANPGEPPRPLAQVASGGETSRLMLALKSAFSAMDDTPVLVFDEIEAGVGARSGRVIGEKLRQLARHHQVLCITHLAPVAALAGSHYRVRKIAGAGTTSTTVDLLTGAERVDELAEMLAGAPVSAAARASAQALLDSASGSPG